jgi:hypothetical protein
MLKKSPTFFEETTWSIAPTANLLSTRPWIGKLLVGCTFHWLWDRMEKDSLNATVIRGSQSFEHKAYSLNKSSDG